MFFFIAGIQPKTQTLDSHPRMCPSCGLYQAHLKRTDHYFSLFFLPIFSVKKGMPHLECQRCGALSDEAESLRSEPRARPVPVCPHCGGTLERAFRYCPSCGKPVG